MMVLMLGGRRSAVQLFESGNDLDQSINQMLVQAGPGRGVRLAGLSSAPACLLGDRLHLLQRARDITKCITGIARIDLIQSPGMRRGINRLGEVNHFGKEVKELGSLKLLGMPKRAETELIGDLFLHVSGIVDRDLNLEF